MKSTHPFKNPLIAMRLWALALLVAFGGASAQAQERAGSFPSIPVATGGAQPLPAAAFRGGMVEFGGETVIFYAGGNVALVQGESTRVVLNFALSWPPEIASQQVEEVTLGLEIAPKNCQTVFEAFEKISLPLRGVEAGFSTQIKATKLPKQLKCKFKPVAVVVGGKNAGQRKAIGADVSLNIKAVTPKAIKQMAAAPPPKPPVAKPAKPAKVAKAKPAKAAKAKPAKAPKDKAAKGKPAKPPKAAKAPKDKAAKGKDKAAKGKPAKPPKATK